MSDKNVRKVMSVEGFSCEEVRRILIQVMSVIKLGHFPLSIVGMANEGNVGCLRLIGQEDLLEKLENMFSAIIFPGGQKEKIAEIDPDATDRGMAKDFLGKIAACFTGSISPMSFPMTDNRECIRIACDDHSWKRVKAFVTKARFETIEREGRLKSEMRIPMEA